jgi:hypothetical protein
VITPVPPVKVAENVTGSPALMVVGDAENPVIFGAGFTVTVAL